MTTPDFKRLDRITREALRKAYGPEFEHNWEWAKKEEQGHRDKSSDFGRTADQIRTDLVKQGKTARDIPAPDADLTPTDPEYHDRFADAHNEAANHYKAGIAAHEKGDHGYGEYRIGMGQDLGYHLDDLENRGRHPGYRAFGSSHKGPRPWEG